MTDDDFPDALPAGHRLHWYVLERVLGQGGFGITYLAHDSNLDRRVAIKEYLPAEVARRRADASARPRTESHAERFAWGLERFLAEARTLARFDHPNIVRVLSVFEANNTAYMVMRFEEGEDLGSLLERVGTLPERELTSCLMPILEGLQLVHTSGFIHRDIKPENIYVREDGSPVLLDFGSARQSFGSAKTMTILVAPGYAPLEQYYGDARTQGPWTDIYGLGATCYRAIAGRAPLDAIARAKGVLGSTRDLLEPAATLGRGRYDDRLLAAVDHSLQLSERDRPQGIVEWRREIAAPLPAPTGHAALTAAAAAAAQPVDGERDAPGPARALGESTRPVSPPTGEGIARRLPSLRAPAAWAALGGACVAGVAWIAFGSARLPGDATSGAPARASGVGAVAATPMAAAVSASGPARTVAAASDAASAATTSAIPRTSPPRLAADVVPASPRPALTAAAASGPVPRQPSLREATVRETAVREAAVRETPSRESPGREPVGRNLGTAPQRPTVAPIAVARPTDAAASSVAAPAIALAAPISPGPASAPTTATPNAAARRRDEQLDAAEVALRGGDAARAAQLAEPLADAGLPRAQALLGRAQEARSKDQRNDFQAYLWYSIAARHGEPGAQALKDKISSRMQPAEIRQADKLAEAWRPHAEPVASGERTAP